MEITNELDAKTSNSYSCLTTNKSGADLGVISFEDGRVRIDIVDLTARFALGYHKPVAVKVQPGNEAARDITMHTGTSSSFLFYDMNECWLAIRRLRTLTFSVNDVNRNMHVYMFDVTSLPESK